MRRAAGLAFLLCALLVSSAAVAQQPNQRVVRQLKFEGNRAIPDEVLAAAIVTTSSSWFARAFFFRSLGLGAKRYFDEEEFRRDVVRLSVLYKRSGYPDAVIDTLVRRTRTSPSRSTRATQSG
jgi:outer membrane protein assembly factor BamA